MNHARALAASVAASALGLTLVACNASVSVGTKTVDKQELATQVQSDLSKSVGKQSPPITCPDDLQATVGASTTCLKTDDDGTTYNVAVNVTSVDDGIAKFDIQVADKPNP